MFCITGQLGSKAVNMPDIPFALLTFSFCRGDDLAQPCHLGNSFSNDITWKKGNISCIPIISKQKTIKGTLTGYGTFLSRHSWSSEALERQMKTHGLQETEIVHLLELQTLHELGIFFSCLLKRQQRERRGGGDHVTHSQLTHWLRLQTLGQQDWPS